MKTITFIRHAQSLFNSGEATGSMTNCALSKEGVESCKMLEQEFDLLIISPLKRAIQTYANSNIKVGQVIISPLFREVKSLDLNFMDLENKENKETDDEIVKRAHDAVQFAMDQSFNRIGVISHHDFLHVLIKENFGRSMYFSNLQSVTFDLHETID